MDKDLDSDSDVDTELYLRDYEQITAVLRADEPSTSGLNLPRLTYATTATATTASSVATATAVSSLSTPSINQSAQEISDIEEALFLNKLMNEKYQKLEQTLMESLLECQAKLKALRETVMPRERDDTFRYYLCGKPYFKDPSGDPAPQNSDTVIMDIANMYDFSSLTLMSGWTEGDKKQLTEVMLEASRNIKVHELLSKISKLKRESLKTGKDVDPEITALSKEIINTKKKTLEEVALPLDKEYDWEMLSYRLSKRHTIQEYKAYWEMLLHPSINKSSWTKAEQKKLLEIASKYKYQDWAKIAKELNTGRSCYQCFLYYRTNMSITSGKKWSKDEVEYLKRVVDYYKEDEFIPWGKVAAAMDNRTKIQVYNKYNRLLEERKGRFIPEEDSIIWNCYQKYGVNFKKMATFLPGRSIIQLRTRFNILSQKSFSTSWTLKEDRKLLELMANEESKTTFFANATKHFPGKKRENIRSRYLTLMNWIKKNPNANLSQAPRRSVRRLTHGTPITDLDKAVENLEERIKSDVELKKATTITKDSPDEVIEEAIITTLMKEQSDNLCSSGSDEDNNTASPNKTPAQASNRDLTPFNTDVIRNLLLLMNSVIQPEAFKVSDYYNKYPSLGDNKEIKNSDVKTTIKSYSKKQQVTTVVPKKTLNVYGHNSLGPLSYVMPPNYSNILGCRTLAKLTSKAKSRADININSFMRHNAVLKEHMTILLERFHFLFTWPIMLSSTMPPNDIASSSSSQLNNKSETVTEETKTDQLTNTLPGVSVETLSKDSESNNNTAPLLPTAGT